jgi:hypothetical protein
MAFRHGNNVSQSFQGTNIRFQPVQDPNVARSNLPDWMKTPETRAIEALQQRQAATGPQAKKLHLQAVPRPAGQPVQAVSKTAGAKKAGLKLVANNGPVTRTKKAASSKKAAAKPKTAAKSRTKTSSRTVAAKRKAA